MSQFTITIPDDARQSLTVPPPPMWNKRTGEFIQYADPTSGRYADVARVKAGNTVYVDEELDVYKHPGSHSHYRMMIRRMPWRADLELILRAAHHLMLIGEYTCEYEHREGLSPDMESGFWDVQYMVPRQQLMVDADTMVWSEVVIPYAQRKRIWLDLFAAMGHKVKWGGAVLNVRKRKV